MEDVPTVTVTFAMSVCTSALRILLHGKAVLISTKVNMAQVTMNSSVMKDVTAHYAQIALLGTRAITVMGTVLPASLPPAKCLSYVYFGRYLSLDVLIVVTAVLDLSIVIIGLSNHIWA